MGPQAMLSDQMASRLCEAAQNVLEMMCSSPVLRDEEFPPANVQNPILVELRFAGRANGRFLLAVDLPTGEALATTFMGLTGPVERQQVVEVLAELSNMLCGQFLGQWNLEESFDLTSPAEVDRNHIASENELRPGDSYQRTVFLEVGTLSMNVIVEYPVQ